jgi:hypothetical protein
MKRYELEAKSKDDLREHAKTMGISFGEDETKGTLVDRILGEFSEPPVIKEKDQVKKQVDRAPPPTTGLYTLDGKKINGKKFKVKIFATESDKSDVHLIVNGYNVVVKRNVDVLLDEAYVEVLRNAVVSTVIQDPDTGERIPQTIQVYPHQAIAI